MAFNTPSFFVFLPIAFLAFALAGERLRWQVLLGSSLFFYATLKSPWLLAALTVVTLTSWIAGRAISRAEGEPARRAALWGGVAVNVGVLVAFRFVPPMLNVVWLSVGVSYFVFQAISYLADVYLGVIEPEGHPGYFALSLALFPKLLQGPIERSGDLLPQLRQPWTFDYDEIRRGLFMFGQGLFRKVVIADRLALYVDAVYAAPGNHSGSTLLLATYAYAAQIFFDFSGYTDMALGVARLFGIRLTQNFNSPYSATSIADFWRRWHISFSRWILDYIFKPLQMRWRNAGSTGSAAALLVTFLISGAWHGATSGFLAWGLLHGLYMAASVFWRPHQKRIHKALRLDRTALLALWQRFVTFHLVCIAWVFFRTPSAADAVGLLARIPALGRPVFRAGAFDGVEGGLLLAALPLLWLLRRASPDEAGRVGFLAWPTVGRWAAYVVLAYTCFFFHVRSAGFIYFGF